MTTRATRPVYREVTSVTVDGRRLIVGIEPGGTISLRRKGTRQTVDAPIAWIFEAWQRIEKRAERRRRRKERRDARITAQALMALEARDTETKEA